LIFAIVSGLNSACGLDTQRCSVAVIYTVSQKNIPDIFNSNLKTNYQILIIFTEIFLTQLAIKRPLSFPPHPMYASALPRKSRPNEICGEINRKPEKISPTLLIAT